MPVDVHLRLRLEAHLRGQAVPTHSHRRITIQPDGLVIAALQFPGDDGLLQAIALGGPGDAMPRLLRVLPNPRDRAMTDRLLEEVGTVLEATMESAWARGGYPQIVVASPAALGHLTNLADDLRFWDARPAAAAAAHWLSHFTTRAEVPGQQAVAVLTLELAHHWVTPLPPTAEHHLGILVAALTTPLGGDLLARAAAASRVPMGPRTDPVFDREQLEPPLRRYAAAVRRGAPPETSEAHAAAIQRAIAPVLLRIWRAMRVALDLIAGVALPPLPVLADLEIEERQAFGRFRALTAAGGRLPRHDRARGGAIALTAREEATATLAQAIACYDVFGRATALSTSQHLEVVVTAVRQAAVPGRRRRATLIEAVTRQRAARLRVDDELITADGPTVAGVVRATTVDGAETRLILMLTQGVRAPARYAPGRRLCFARRRPDPHRVGRAVRAVAAKLAPPHWTRGDVPLPLAQPRGAGAPPRRLLEMLP